MVNDSIGGVRLNCLIAAWASVVNVVLCSDVSAARCGDRNPMYRIYISHFLSVIKRSGSAVNHDDCLSLLTSHLLKSWRTTRRWQCHLPAAYPVMSATARRETESTIHQNSIRGTKSVCKFSSVAKSRPTKLQELWFRQCAFSVVYSSCAFTINYLLPFALP